MLRNLFRQRPDERQGDALYALAVEQARQPAFYTSLGVADRIDARFELYTLHVLILFLRLKQDGERGEVAAQKLFDTYISSLDHTLRELGVGDVSVGKKMRKLGESLYGRMSAYEGSLRAEDVDALAASLAKNVYESADAATGDALARYAVTSRQNLTTQSFEAVSKAPAWAEITA
ncbi:ubiquinol-cytochrome C chaperone family protein [Brevundimonas sp.]|uniref:ubiquinol-cytochrome C chaperone family protein n=1 Tax=Brevundimonas sp. TaxID=1871086 RepID=UPI00289E01D7|nr:ubiquinol-cytochrome C chaperone family protein [Brevundimonas sp.]